MVGWGRTFWRKRAGVKVKTGKCHSLGFVRCKADRTSDLPLVLPGFLALDLVCSSWPLVCHLLSLLHNGTCQSQPRSTTWAHLSSACPEGSPYIAGRNCCCSKSPLTMLTGLIQTCPLPSCPTYCLQNIH